MIISWVGSQEAGCENRNWMKQAQDRVQWQFGIRGVEGSSSVIRTLVY
jgi:hypothetical protein